MWQSGMTMLHIQVFIVVTKGTKSFKSLLPMNLMHGKNIVRQILSLTNA